MKNIDGQDITDACLIAGRPCKYPTGRFCVRCGHLKGWRLHTYTRGRVDVLRRRMEWKRISPKRH
jgi:hypothetical protein